MSNWKDRIKLLSRRLYLFIRDFDKERQYASDSVKSAKQQVDRIFNEYYYVIRSYFIKVSDEIQEQKSYNEMLQKQITSLRKEKADLGNVVGVLNSRLDDIEDGLGVSMQETRLKLSNTISNNKQQQEIWELN